MRVKKKKKQEEEQEVPQDPSIMSPQQFDQLNYGPQPQQYDKGGSLYLIRHGETDEDQAGKSSGWDNSPLNKKGIQEAQTTAQDMSKMPLDALYSSDITRAKQTSGIIEQGVNQAANTTHGLTSWNIGKFQGKPSNVFNEKHYVENPEETVPGGESFNEYKGRFLQAYNFLKQQKAQGQDVAAVTHSKGINLANAYEKNGGKWDNNAAKLYFKQDTPEPASLNKFQLGGSGGMTLNDIPNGLVGKKQFPQGGLFDSNKQAYVDSVLNANKNLEWVQRLRQENTPSIQIPGESYRSTHLMADNGQGYVYPKINMENGKLRYIADEDSSENYARTHNLGIQLPTKEGTWFADNGYKQGTNVLKSVQTKGEGGMILNDISNGRIQDIKENGGEVTDKMIDSNQIDSDKYFTRTSSSGRTFKYKRYLN